MPRQPLRLAVIVGSVREGRFGPTIGNWFVRQTRERAHLTVDVIDLADFALPVTMPAFGAEAAPEAALALQDLSPRLAAADAFVVVTPEYNHSFPASLKNAIDWHNHQWYAKPVAFVSYGGISGGLRAVEALRLVFAELHAVTIRDTVSFHNAWQQFSADGTLRQPDEFGRAAKTLLDQLTWWGHALRDAKAITPYLG
ncbi:NAD(P)H-dependent oxidoreductase [Micromonospora polyrhachis]|uniref:NAD(P)H-dependent FMN reductase n=1 Tax=Micromonospora polyrhachis TaxID=1282883 RepID=A0A7W7SR47_9ACTN|nr:NAD(P)H-dependent oxidoreductase [Micromonospora polyrhachis]MBB4958752.1 NAD(P)H-dependent FMN reductase [Micromonospora polyrhachis]